MVLALLMCLQEKVEVKAHQSFYFIHVPTAYSDRKSWPLIVDLHAAGGEDEARRELGEWAELAERRGYIVVAPKSRTKEWGTGKAASDAAFLRACLDAVKTKYRVDPERVLFAGFGRGAAYALEFGAEHKDLLAGCAILMPTEVKSARKGPPTIILTGSDEAGWQRGLAASTALSEAEADVTMRKLKGDSADFPARDEYAGLLDWFEKKVKPRGDLETVEAFVAARRYLDASLILAGLLERPEATLPVRWNLNRLEGRGLIELGKVEIAVSEQRYVDAVLRCREAAAQYAWLPCGERARKRLEALEADPRVRRQLEKDN